MYEILTIRAAGETGAAMFQMNDADRHPTEQFLFALTPANAVSLP